MPSKSKMIELGSKPSKPEVEKTEKNPVYYPGFSVSHDGEIGFPKGPFMARVKMHMKRSESSEDERGNRRHTYHMEMHGIHPEFESAKDHADESGADEAIEDASASILNAFKNARDKKAMESSD